MFGGQALPVEVAVIGKSHNPRQDNAVLTYETNRSHAGMGHIEMGGKDGIRNIQQTA